MSPQRNGLHSVLALAALVAALLLTGCSSLSALARHDANPTLGDALASHGMPRPFRAGPDVIDASVGPSSARTAIIEKGATTAGTTGVDVADPALARRRVTLNFVDTDIREFARVLFSELLKVPYFVDQNISGQVTVRSGGEIDGNAALVIGRQTLEASGDTIRVNDGVYRVTSIAEAGADTSSVRTFALRYIDASAAQGALQGLVQGRAEILNAANGSLTMRGDPETLAVVSSMIAAIDIDRFASASFGLFPLKSGSAADVTEDLRQLYAGVGVTDTTLLTIDRINAVLVIAPRPDELDFAGKWIPRLDQGPQNQRQVYVYQVRNRDADDLAGLLDRIFDATTTAASAPVVQPAGTTDGAPLTAPGNYLAPVRPPDGNLRITSDSSSNKLVVWATQAEYALVDQALRRLDTPLNQVYVEATIAEVRLEGELSHGVRWFLEAGGVSAGYSDASSGAVAPSFPGFNFSFEVPRAEVVISALEAHTNVKIVSSPQLTVVDRQTATIQVGDQVPIVTKTVENASSGDAVIANDVTFRDTGVILHVTPQVRPSGDVLLNIAQEVSRVVPTTSSQIDSPTISQRKVESTVLVPDGTAIVLGGLMNSSDETTNGGLPGTPNTLLESIFGSKKQSTARSELIIIIRPRIIRDDADLREVAEEVKQKMGDVLRLDAN